MDLKTLSSAHISSALAKRAVSAFVLALLSTTTITQPSTAEDKTFFCGTSNGVPATIARTAKGDVPMILWNSPEIAASGDTPQKRCEQVSSKLQNAHNNGTLKYITTEIKNDRLVVCIAQIENKPCTDSLFPLNRVDGERPGESLQKIVGIRVASSTTISETQPFAYLNLDNYLNRKYCTLEEYKEAARLCSDRCAINNTGSRQIDNTGSRQIDNTRRCPTDKTSPYN